MIYYFIWVPLLIILYFFIGYFSVRYNKINTLQNLIPLILLQCLPLWAFVSKVSTHLTLDALIYDTVAIIVCVLTIGIFTNQLSNFNIIQKLGFLLSILGIILLHIK